MKSKQLKENIVNEVEERVYQILNGICVHTLEINKLLNIHAI